MNGRTITALTLAGALCAGAIHGIAGTPDRVPAATLVVPFFEVGIVPGTDPENTLVSIVNVFATGLIVHYHVWDIDGVPIFGGNVTISTYEGWNASLFDLIALQSASDRSALTEGAFYRGFMTFDVVTAETGLDPQDPGYPFGTSNYLEGYTYYTRLSEGSANGLAMIPIEHVGNAVDPFLRDFYQADGLEEIDVDARACAQQLVSGVTPCTGDASPYDVERIHFRTFGSVTLNGRTRLIVFAWTHGLVGGPTTLCDGGACPTSYVYRRYTDSGATIHDGTIELPHVVNFVDVQDTFSGWASIFNVPSVNSDTQIYGFSFNSASPGFDPSLTWDAIFEAYIRP